MNRHYESVDLFSKAVRTDSGYRQYAAQEVNTLRQDRKRPSWQVRALAQAQVHIKELDEKLKELQSMKATLEHLVHRCHGDDRPNCPISDPMAHKSTELKASAHHARSRTAGFHSGRPRRRAT